MSSGHIDQMSRITKEHSASKSCVSSETKPSCPECVMLYRTINDILIPPRQHLRDNN